MTKEEILKHYFGYDSFREKQEELIDAVLEGRDVLGIMPTGSGKSLCYQIPALMTEGVTLVISPLISLMKDQVQSLNQVGIHAAYLNSSLTAAQYYKALQYAREGRYPIIYVAPERLATEEFLDFARNTRIAMVAVDEAHCVSQWGQDFRPSYLKIADFIQVLPSRPVVSAFTATATTEVREDIIDILMLREPAVVSTGYDRPNLYLGVQSPRDKYAAVKNFVECRPGQCGIIYCLTRKQVEEVCQRLNQDGFPSTRYHAGLSDAERRTNQDDFTYDRVPIMVATNAFGMGVDKSNVRYVIHYNLPKSPEAYYQEIGRAGRDGEPAECILLYGGQDVVTNQLFIDNNRDNQELDEMTRRIVQERDRERLRKMTFYCFTNECLRDYILRYFGEYGSNYCGNCSNCLTQFAEADMTEAARAILGCVGACRQRYGTNVILDTLHGANTAKIRNYRMDENPYYASLAKVPAYQLRQVMNELQLRDYLSVTNDEYAIVKLTKKSEAVMSGEESFVMKMAREQEWTAKMGESREKKRRKNTAAGLGGGEFSEADEALFTKLRSLRSEIARVEKVPPYIVFSDKTLTHMCLVKPRTKEEMLEVSGVGEFKFEKYGELFLDCLRGVLGESVIETAEVTPVRMMLSEEDSSERAGFEKKNSENARSAETNPENAVSKKASSKKGKADFSMTEKLAKQLHYPPRCSLSDFIGQINELRDEEQMKRLTIKSVEQKLMQDGLYEEQFFNGMRRKHLTERGAEFGIEEEKRESEKGNEYVVLFYSEKAQRGIVKWLLENT